ncbi:MAG: hypothetical protein ACOX6A_04195 [Atribacter sp.]|jgi:hypothetical protein|uniref:hypothetical protein n=1 Tax=Atribacter sp. TaxID=2847780 RepID=UPI003D981D2D
MLGEPWWRQQFKSEDVSLQLGFGRGREPRLIVKVAARFSAIARARIKEHKVRYTVEKQHSSLWGTRLVVIGVESWGEIEDLYDFNHDAEMLSQWGATVQLGYGNGRHAVFRNAGQIYKTRVLFAKTYTELP